MNCWHKNLGFIKINKMTVPQKCNLALKTIAKSIKTIAKR